MRKLLMAMAVAVAGMSFAQIAIDGENEVGFTAVAAAAGQNTILAVPYRMCKHTGEDTAVMLNALVSTHSLKSDAVEADADQLIILSTNALGKQAYFYYYNKPVGGWTPVTAAQIQPDGSSVLIDPEVAGRLPLAHCQGFWIKRHSASGSNPVYLMGQLPTGTQTVAIKKNESNLVGIIPTGDEAITLNHSGINWTGAHASSTKLTDSDSIVIMNNGISLTYYYFNPSPVPAGYEGLVGKWVTKKYVEAPENVTLPKGIGFWYNRKPELGFSLSPHAEKTP